MLFAEVHGFPQETEPLFFVDEGSVIALKVPIIQCQTHDGSSRGSDKSQVLLCQKIVNHFLEKVRSVLFPQPFSHVLAKRDLGSGESVDEILHVHPAAHTGAS